MSSKSTNVEARGNSPEDVADAAIAQLGEALDKQATSRTDQNRKIQRLEVEKRDLLESNVKLQQKIEQLEIENRNIQSRNFTAAEEEMKEADERKLELLQKISKLEDEVKTLKDQNKNLQNDRRAIQRIPGYPSADDFSTVEQALDWAEDQIIRNDDEARRREGRLKSQLARAQVAPKSADADLLALRDLQRSNQELQEENRSLKSTLNQTRNDRDKLVRLLETIKESALSKGNRKAPIDASRADELLTPRLHKPAPRVQPKETPSYPSPLKSIKDFAETNN